MNDVQIPLMTHVSIGIHLYVLTFSDYNVIIMAHLNQLEGKATENNTIKKYSITMSLLYHLKNILQNSRKAMAHFKVMDKRFIIEQKFKKLIDDIHY